MREMSAAQYERQQVRERTGRYSTFNPCDVCERGVGHDYYSTQYTDQTFTDAAGNEVRFGDAGLVLHGDCAAIVDAKPIAEAFAFLVETPAADRRKVVTAYRRARGKGAK